MTLIFPSEFTVNKGGVPQSIISIVTELATKCDFNIVVICPSNSEMSKVPFPTTVKVLCTPQSEWIISKSHIYGTFCTVFSIYKLLRSYIDKGAWLITNHAATSALLSLMPCKHVPEVYINRGGDFKDNSISSIIMRYRISRHKIEYAVGISKRQVEMLKETGQSEEYTFLVHNGLPLPTKIYSFRPLNSSFLSISTIGFISDLKNQKEGVRLIKLLRHKGINAILNIYGIPDDDKEYQVELSDLINQLGVKEYVNYCGFVTGEKLFENTDILISFSKTEGFGRSIVEGMLRYKPVIAWRGAGGPIDITQNGKYGHLVDNNEANDYCDVILKLLNDPELNKQNTIESHQHAIENFTVDSMVDKYNRLFNKICI